MFGHIVELAFKRLTEAVICKGYFGIILVQYEQTQRRQAATENIFHNISQNISKLELNSTNELASSAVIYFHMLKRINSGASYGSSVKTS